MAIAQLQPNDRYAIVGKTGSGKTMLAVVLAGYLARSLGAPWEVWWIDTKNVDDDLKLLRRWGFRNYANPDDRATSLIRNALYWYVTTSDVRYDPETVDQVQEICRQAYDRKNVVLIIDEYVQAVPSQRDAGAALKNVFQRGRGRQVGLIGLTQEPVYVPRLLISQATHTVMMNMTYGYDIKYLREIDKLYRPPAELGDRHGFFWRWNDGGGEMDYYPNQRVWAEQLRVAMDRAEHEYRQSDQRGDRETSLPGY